MGLRFSIPESLPDSEGSREVLKHLLQNRCEISCSNLLLSIVQNSAETAKDNTSTAYNSSPIYVHVENMSTAKSCYDSTRQRQWWPSSSAELHGRVHFLSADAVRSSFTPSKPASALADFYKKSDLPTFVLRFAVVRVRSISFCEYYYGPIGTYRNVKSTLFQKS